MVTEVKPLAEISRQAIRLIYQEMGAVNAARFLKQFTAGFGDYTKEREALFDHKTLEQIMGEIEQRRKQA